MGFGAAAPAPGPRYERLGLLGVGGMGRVYLARDTRLGREVALKEAQTPALAERLAREARVTAGLEHPGIVAVYDEGLGDEGRPFYVMRLVRGRPLAERLPVSTPAARAALLRAFLVACEAMAYAHERGIVHRDLKPANLVIGEHGETQVVDWGLAMTVGVADRAVGTPGYMSPEQGAGGPIGPASDVWSLGAILREIVGPTPPAELAAIVDRALAAEPTRRYADAAALAADLEAWLDGRQVSAYAYSPLDLARRFARAWRAPLTVAGVGALALAALGVWSFVRVRDERDRAVTAERETRDALSRADTALARALQNQAREALTREGLLEAERLAAEALLREESPLTRGILAGARAAVRPALRGAAPTPACPMLVALDLDDVVCADATSLWRARAGAELWRVPVAGVDRMRVVPGDRLLVARDSVGRTYDLSSGHVDADWTIGMVGPTMAWVSQAADEVHALTLRACGAVAPRGITGTSDHMALLCEDGQVRVGAFGALSAPAHRVDPALFPNLLLLELVGPDTLVIGDVRGRVSVVGPTGAWTQEPETPDAPRRVALSPAGRRLAVARESGVVELFTFPDLRRVAVLPAPNVRDIRFAPDGELIVASGTHLTRWASPATFTPPLFEGDDGVTSVQFSPDGARMGTTHGGGQAALWDLADGSRVRLPHDPTSTVKAGAFSPDGGAFWTIDVGNGAPGASYRPRRWSVPDGALAGSPPDQVLEAWFVQLGVVGVANRAAGRRIAVRGDGAVVVLPYVPGVVGLDASGAVLKLDCAAYASNDLAARGEHVVFSTKTGEVVRLGPDGRCVAVAGAAGGGAVDVSADGTVWIAGDGWLQRVGGWKVDHPGGASDVAVSPDGRWVATAGPERLARVWDARDGRLIAELPGHTERVVAVAFAPDSQRLATGSWDRHVRMWSIAAFSAAPAAMAAEARAASVIDGLE